MDRPVQYFTDEYLEHCKKMKPEHILKFLEEFRLLHGGKPTKKKLISLRISETLLEKAAR